MNIFLAILVSVPVFVVGDLIGAYVLNISIHYVGSTISLLSGLLLAVLVGYLIYRKQRGLHKINRREVKIAILAFFLLDTLLISVFLLLTDSISYTIAIARCGKLPIVASNFAASRTYDRPQDPGYGHGIFRNIYFCSEEDAVNSDYRGRPGSLSDTREKERDAQIAEQEKFSPSKIRFIAYSPTYVPRGFTMGPPTVDSIQGDNQVFHRLDSTTAVVSLRQAAFGISSVYFACSQDPCDQIGQDQKGNRIFRSPGKNGSYTQWAITFKDSFINIEGADGVISEQDIIKIFNSLQPIK